MIRYFKKLITGKSDEFYDIKEFLGRVSDVSIDPISKPTHLKIRYTMLTRYSISCNRMIIEGNTFNIEGQFHNIVEFKVSNEEVVELLEYINKLDKINKLKSRQLI